MACRTSRRSCTIRCSTGSACSNQEVARAEMARDPKLRQFARETYEFIGQGIPRAPRSRRSTHAEYLKRVREMA